MNRRSATSGAAEIALLERAGYSVRSEHQVSLGMVALTAARTVCLAVGGSSAVPGTRVAVKTGRNDPCPCGSGRKYKRCCLGKSEAAQAPRSEPISPAVTADMIPRMGDEAGVERETKRLAALLRDDPDLESLRFSPETVSRLMERRRETLVAAREADRSYELDRLATECSRLPENQRVMKQVSDVVLGAATKGGHTPSKIRSLAFLLVLAGTEASTPKGETSMLASLIFRRSLAEIVDAPDPLEDLVDRLGGRDALRARLLQKDPTLGEEVRALAETLEPASVRRLQEAAQERYEPLRTALDEGRYPVGLPIALVLPILVDLVRADKAARGTASDASKAGILERRMKEWVGPEVQIYQDLTARWLEAHAGEDPSVRKAVALAKELAMAGSLAPFDADLLHLSFEQKNLSLLDGEEALLPGEPSRLASPPFLRKYAKFLDEKGYPANAARIRGLLEPSQGSLGV